MKVIVVEDNPVYRSFVCGWLNKEGFITVDASNVRDAKRIVGAAGEDDIILSDLRLPDGDGIGLLEWMRNEGRMNPAIIMTDYDEAPTAVQSMRAGAKSYIPKKVLDKELLPMLHDLRKRLEKCSHKHPIFGRESKAFQEIQRRVKLVATTDLSVLVLGENGTGKEHIAEKIHAQSRRREKPFVAVDCGTLSPQLAESELFGHVKGAFTGAEGNKTGYFGEAKGGTLFLDEVGNLPLEVQRMLLRAIQSRIYRPKGASADKTADVRIIAATNEDLAKAVAEGRFRQDLYYRLKEFIITVPPLRQCREDILPLARFFMELANEELDRDVQGFDEDAEKALLTHSWPGNVRELRQTVFSAVLMAENDTIRKDGLRLEEPPCPEVENLTLRNENREKEHILQALEETGWNREAASQRLGISRTTLYYKMVKFGITAKKG